MGDEAKAGCEAPWYLLPPPVWEWGQWGSPGHPFCSCTALREKTASSPSAQIPLPAAVSSAKQACFLFHMTALQIFEDSSPVPAEPPLLLTKHPGS